MSYSATIGRLLERDPSGYDDSISLYDFVGSNPLKFADPYGLMRPPTEAENRKLCEKFSLKTQFKNTLTDEQNACKGGQKQVSDLAEAIGSAVAGESWQ